jgi:hypothetical protein
MSGAWRRWIAGLLLVTLPLQGAVAAAGLCCLPHERGSEVADGTARAGAPPCHHGDAAGTEAAADAAAADDQADDQADDNRDHDRSGAEHTTGDRCHACAGCALAVALPAKYRSTPGPMPAAAQASPLSEPAGDRAAPPPEPPPRA